MSAFDHVMDRVISLFANLAKLAVIPSRPQRRASQPQVVTSLPVIALISLLGIGHAASAAETCSSNQPWLACHSEPEAPLPAVSDKVWLDPQTGLMWTRCPFQMDQFRDRCKPADDKPAYLTWADAILKIEGTEYLGFNDWRVPTIEELRANDKLYDEDYFPDTGIVWSATRDEHRNLDSDPLPSTSFLMREGDYYRTENWKEKYSVMLIRGGKRPENYAQIIELAKVAGEADSKEKAATAARDAKMREDHQLRDEKRRQDEIRAQQKYAADKMAYEARTVSFRKTVNPGDKTVDGLVIEVKGDLVKVQKYDRRYPSVVTGVEWVRRSDLLPHGKP